uniref:Rho-GAP domain-containing protein n=1 Tax=Macrostomum lignano TaxID=282301 RepID=A0A1I8HYN1_9PLAT
MAEDSLSATASAREQTGLSSSIESAERAVIEGWIQVQGFLGQRWSNRYARLFSNGQFLVYKKKSNSPELDDLLLLQQLDLTKCDLKTFDDTADEKEFQFSILPTTAAASAPTPLTIRVSSRPQLKRWLAQLYLVAYASRGGVAFGQPLSEVMTRQVAAGGQAYLPRLVGDCLDRLSLLLTPESCQSPIRLRASGRASSVRQLKRAYQRGDRVRPLEFSANDAVSLLRLYLAELPEPVVPAKVRAELLARCSTSLRRKSGGSVLLGMAGTANRLLKPVDQGGLMPPENLNLLLALCRYMRRQVDSGLETVDSLSGQFAASLFSARIDTTSCYDNDTDTTDKAGGNFITRTIRSRTNRTRSASCFDATILVKAAEEIANDSTVLANLIERFDQVFAGLCMTKILSPLLETKRDSVATLNSPPVDVSAATVLLLRLLAKRESESGIGLEACRVALRIPNGGGGGGGGMPRWPPSSQPNLLSQSGDRGSGDGLLSLDTENLPHDTEMQRYLQPHSPLT